MFESDTLKNSLLAIFLFVSSPASASTFFFVALGDTAYHGESDQAVYRALIKLINETKPSFTIHVGDVWGAEKCIREKYEAIFETFNLFDRPVIYTPGDNEWTDCRRVAYGAYAPAGRLKVLRKIFFSTDKSMGANPMKLTRQSDFANYPLYVENSRWLHNQVLFLLSTYLVHQITMSMKMLMH